MILAHPNVLLPWLCRRFAHGETHTTQICWWEAEKITVASLSKEVCEARSDTHVEARKL